MNSAHLFIDVHCSNEAKFFRFSKIIFFLLDVMNGAHLFIDVYCSNGAKFFRFSSIAAARFLCLWS